MNRIFAYLGTLLAATLLIAASIYYSFNEQEKGKFTLNRNGHFRKFINEGSGFSGPNDSIDIHSTFSESVIVSVNYAGCNCTKLKVIDKASGVEVRFNDGKFVLGYGQTFSVNVFFSNATIASHRKTFLFEFIDAIGATIQKNTVQLGCDVMESAELSMHECELKSHGSINFVLTRRHYIGESNADPVIVKLPSYDVKKIDQKLIDGRIVEQRYYFDIAMNMLAGHKLIEIAPFANGLVQYIIVKQKKNSGIIVSPDTVFIANVNEKKVYSLILRHKKDVEVKDVHVVSKGKNVILEKDLHYGANGMTKIKIEFVYEDIASQKLPLIVDFMDGTIEKGDLNLAVIDK